MNFDIPKLLTGLGIEPLGIDEHDELFAFCPSHNDTGKPNWSINVLTGQHHCWSCGYGGSLMGLIAKVLDYRWDDDELDLLAARRWARRYRSADLPDIPSLENPKWEHGTKSVRQVVITEASIARFGEVPAWALKARSLTADAATKYGVRWDAKNSSWITPIREPFTHYLRGWQVKGQKDRMFRNHPVGVEKADTLFGLHTFTGGRAVLVESPLDVIRLESVGITGGLATYGASVSARQIDVIAAYADSAVIAMDNPRLDSAGRESSLMLQRKLTRRMPTWMWDYDNTAAKDVGDMTDAEILEGLDHARFALFRDSVHV